MMIDSRTPEVRSTTLLVSGVVCLVLGLFASFRFGFNLVAGTVDAVDFDPLLLPIGIALLRPGRFAAWLARVQLFLMAVISAATVVVFLLMTPENRSITFSLHDNIGVLSGGGIILLSQGLFLAAVLWIYFSIFAAPPETRS